MSSSNQYIFITFAYELQHNIGNGVTLYQTVSWKSSGKFYEH